MLKILQPDYCFKNVLNISKVWLQTHDFLGIILDVDNTFVSRDALLPSEIYMSWLCQLQEAGIKVVLLSNNGGFRAMQINLAVKTQLFTWAGKPWPGAFEKAETFLNLPMSNILVVGDQIFTDVLGAHLKGLKVGLVNPLPGKDFWATTIMRHFEKIILRTWKENGKLKLEEESQ